MSTARTSALQPMPVADAICQPGRKIFYPGMSADQEPRWVWSTEFRDQMLSRCKRVNFGEAPEQTDVLPLSRRQDSSGAELALRLRDAVGPQILPFDYMWLEGTWPGMENWVAPITDAVAVRASSAGTVNRDTLKRVPSVALLFEYELTWDYDDNFLLPEIGAPGIEYLHRRGPIQGREDVWVTADWLVYRDDVGLLGGILIRFPKTVRDKTGRRVVPAGELTLIVKPDHQRRGVGAALLEDAASRWAVDWAAQRYSARGLELIKSVVDRGMIEARFDVCSLVVTDSGEPVLEFADTIGNEP